MSVVKYEWGIDMKVGDLVRYNDDGDIGIILEVDVDFDYYRVHWSDGCEDFHLESEMEVLDEYR